MKKYFILSAIVSLLVIFFSSCTKTMDKKDLYKAPHAIAAPVSDAVCLGSDPANNAIKGTMLAGKTYTVCGDVFVNENDTLMIQEGVTVKFTGKFGIGVKGTLICLGTREKPNLFTYPDVTKTDTYGADPNTDPALHGQWIGIIGGPTCPLMVVKWTRIEFGGAAIPTNSAIRQVYTSPYPLFFQNPNGVFVLEDSWIYGSTDDPLRMLGGKVSIMRNVFEKCGYTGGEALNGKAGLRGDFAYNLCIGMATNGPKLSNAGALAGVPSSNMRMYNNTIINCGYRRSSAGRGGSINFEEGAGGMAYNNLIVNCKFGLRVVQNPIADTANLRYGYNFYYADSQAVANNILPSLAISVCISNAIATDIPNPFTYLPNGWKPGDSYTAPASQIQSIEVISSPGAKYDATGTGGIINIVLRKNKSQGFSGTVNATAGTRLENGSLNLTYKNNNIAFNGYFSGSSQLKAKTLTETSRNSYDTTTGNAFFLHQAGSSSFTRGAYRTGIGMDWDITPKDNLSFSAGYNSFGNKNNGFANQYNSESDKNGFLLTETINDRLSNTRYDNHALDLGLDYRRKLKREKQELSFSFNYSTGRNNTFYLQTQQNTGSSLISGGSTSRNPGKDRLATFGVDYATPLGKDFVLETGLKTEYEVLTSNANVFTFSPQQYDYVFDDKQSYTSSFRRQVYAGYVSGTFQLFHVLNVIAGARLEHTVNHAEYSNSSHVSIPDYNNFGPSLILSHSFNNQQTINFSYSYRLERPEYRDLNPFVNLTDPHNIVTGNPYIVPEIGRDYHLGYNYNFGKDNNLNIILLYTYNSPDIKSYTTFYPEYQVGDSIFTNVNVTRRSNIASEQRWGLNLSGAFTFGSKLTLRPSIQLYERHTTNIYSIPNKMGGFEYRGNLNANYQFNKNLVAEIFGNYRSGIKWQGRQAGFYSYSLAMRHQLFKGKGSIGLVAVNAFGKYLTQKTTQLSSGFTGTTRLDIPYRSFGINFMYRFGKIKISKPKEEDNLLIKPPAEG